MPLMGLHNIIEPAGTLLMGWNLVPRDPAEADIRNNDATKAGENAEPQPVSPHEAKAPVAPFLKARSKWEVSEIG